MPARRRSPQHWILFAVLGLFPPSHVVAGHRLALQGNGKLAIVDASGALQWEMPWGGIHDIHVLDNGNLMVQEQYGTIVEIDPKTKKRVWSYDSAISQDNDGRRVEVHAFQPLANGNVMIAESGAGASLDAYLETVNASEQAVRKYATQLVIQSAIEETLNSTFAQATIAEAEAEIARDPLAWTEVCAAHILVETAEEADSKLDF